jgi:hypothetical protein
LFRESIIWHLYWEKSGVNNEGMHII